MGSRLPNPFPGSEWAPDAYQNAAYMSVAMGYEFDLTTAIMRTQPHTHRGKKEPLRGAPGEVLTDPEFIACMGHIPTEELRLNMAFMLGYITAQLAERGMLGNGITRSQRVKGEANNGAGAVDG